ncbi:DUF4232 domain-containing protein [Streptomyces sp. WAC06614]|uniref:DUF4232 domain-containing protein n=1 Tax=Streptomyces sp. WAC06614 TaxID=2487416 RepID=UPI000F782103|nr:DUF4232 domain-containing protein [Streptomyces sp. WAC06614]RSS78270.1 DUF4232 domain-containing protein [Streptomyces sp. WAC06614]
MRVLLASAVLAGGMLLAGGGAAVADTAGEAVVRAPTPPCRSSQLAAVSAARTGAAQVRITVVNDGSRACALKGYPTVAVAGLGSPQRNKPLSVQRLGTARTVVLPAGGTASTTVRFTPVLGEADGYCASGAEPTVAPSLVVGVAGGAFQLAPDDGGEFALCGTAARVTAFR